MADELHDPCPLTRKERCQVVGISVGFLLVFELLAYLSYRYMSLDEAYEAMVRDFRAGEIKEGLAKGTIHAMYALGVPMALIASTCGIMHGLRGRRTSLTDWVLSQMNQNCVQEQHQQMIDAGDALGELSPSDKILLTYLSPKVGWGIFLGFLASVVAFFVVLAVMNR